jgi:hypothetical protein
MNMHQINQLISNFKFDESLTVIDNYVFVNLDWLTNRDYQSQGVNEIIFSAGQYPDSIFVFLIRDGVNCQLTGLGFVIETIVKNLQLNSETCYIYGYDDLKIPNTTFIELDVVQMWCSLIYQQLKNHQRVYAPCNKKFAALFGRHDLHRLKIVKYLHENYYDQSILSYNSACGTWNARFETIFNDDKTWYQKNCPIILDFDGSSGWVPYQQSLQKITSHINDYFLEIVCETDVYSNKFFTEKSLKNFFLKKPFILMSGKHSLRELQNRGFKTFSPWIDESYDNISCPNKRLQNIFREIDRLASFSVEKVNQLYAEMLPIFEHNEQNFLKFS